MTTSKRKFKIYQEEAKIRQTSHWDWDYMSTAELEALMQERQERDRQNKPDRERLNQQPEAETRELSRLIKLLAGLLVVILSAAGFLALYLD